VTSSVLGFLPTGFALFSFLRSTSNICLNSLLLTLASRCGGIQYFKSGSFLPRAFWFLPLHYSIASTELELLRLLVTSNSQSVPGQFSSHIRRSLPKSDRSSECVSWDSSPAKFAANFRYAVGPSENCHKNVTGNHFIEIS
jgi:hypothetical protein